MSKSLNSATIKRFVSYYKPHRKLFILDMSCALALAVIDLIFPMLTRQFINQWIPLAEISTILWVGMLMIGMFVLRMVFSYIVAFFGHYMGSLLEFDMRKDLFNHIETLPYHFFSNQKIGQIINRFVGDLRDIAELSHHGPEDLFISSIMLVGSFIILFRIQPTLTLIVFFFMFVLLVFSIIKRRDIERSFSRVRESHGEMNASIESSISGIRLTKSFTNEAYEIKKFNRVNTEYQRSWKDVYRAIAVFVCGNGFFIDLLNLSVLVIGSLFVIQGAINIGDLAAYLLYAAFTMQPVRRLMFFVEGYESGISGFRRFLELMDAKSDILEKEDATELSNCKGHITLREVSFCYKDGHQNVISKVSLDVHPGQNIALVGPSGAGKTTISNLIPRFYDVTEGAVLIDGHDVRQLTLESLRKNIGIVQQDVVMFWGSIKENIAYGRPDAPLEDIINAAKNARIWDFILSLPQGLDSFVGERGVKLSGGQKQRIAIARVFLKNPPILILDEATSSLDNATEAEIQKAIEKLSLNRTTITIAHRLSTIKQANRIAVLKDDSISEIGTHDELIKLNGYYAMLFQAQYEGFLPDQISENS
jgi:ATP-binding cassette, subfamily B, bacterial